MIEDKYKKDFSDFGEMVWLNAASEGPLPLCSAEALSEAVKWKQLPHLLTIEKFHQIPSQLKKSIAKLVGVPAHDVILGNSATYGLDLLANGLSFESGDEICVMQNDFPTNILPWLGLEEKGVGIRQIPAKDHILTPEELEANITPQTKVFCISHVHTFSGRMVDVKLLSEICRAHNIIFVLNVSQFVGSAMFNLEDYDVDAIVCAGYKWLCGPSSTGFCWIKPDIREKLDLNRAYWATSMSEEALLGAGDVKLTKTHSARKYDVYSPANFFNFVPFKSSIDYLLEIGLESISAHNQDLIDLFIEQVDRSKYQFISYVERERRSNLCVFSHKKPALNKEIHKSLIDNNIYTALWKGNIRLSPHIYNISQDIHRIIDVLNSL